MIDAPQPSLGDYRIFIDEIFRRLDAIEGPLPIFKADPNHPDAWKYCDFSWLQIRKICEYLAIAIVFAHHQDTKAVGDLSKWRPKDLLAQAAALNDYPTPVQIAPVFKLGSNGERQITPVSRPIQPTAIQAIYGRCSDLVHVGKLSRILDGKLPSYDLSQLEVWIRSFRNLLANHMLLLPGIQTVLVCIRENGQTKLIILASEGAVFDTANLPEFEFYDGINSPTQTMAR